MKNKVISIIFIMFIVTITVNFCYAERSNSVQNNINNLTNEASAQVNNNAQTSQTHNKTEYDQKVASCQNKGFLGSIICESHEFSRDRNETGTIKFGSELEKFLLSSDGVVGLVYDIGCLVILVVVIVLGTKYIFVGASGKADIKSSLVNFIVAVVIFTMAKPIYGLIDGTLADAILGKTSFEDMGSSLWATIAAVIQLASFAGIIITGISYMFNPAEKRSQMKNSLIAVVVGIILVFCFTEVLDFIVTVSRGLLS